PTPENASGWMVGGNWDASYSGTRPPWAPANMRSIEVRPSYNYSGQLLAQVTQIGSATGPGFDGIPVPGAESYRASVWVRTTWSIQPEATMRMEFYDAQGQMLTSSSSSPLALDGDAWTELSMTATAPSGTATIALSAEVSVPAAVNPYYSTW